MTSAVAPSPSRFDTGIASRLTRWLDAIPHPHLAIEIAADRIAVARWSRSGSLDTFAAEVLPPGALVPSAVETNIINSAAINIAVSKACERVHVKSEEDVALILPDPVIRIFVQHFEEFPRNADEAIPMLRWKLKKSIPFEADETIISYMRQPQREAGVDVVTALARLRIVREYEAVAEKAALYPGVVLSSSLAAISLLEDEKATLLARVSGTSLTTVIVRSGVLCGYRCTELPARGASLTPQMLLEEIFPVAAYYQDTWNEAIGSVRLAGLGARLPEFVRPFEAEFRCPVRSLLQFAFSEGRIKDDMRQLADRDLEGLVGWVLQRG